MARTMLDTLYVIKKVLSLLETPMTCNYNIQDYFNCMKLFEKWTEEIICIKNDSTGMIKSVAIAGGE